MPPAHPRVLTWLSTSALALGGSNQSLFLLSALLVGQEAIPGQGSAAFVLLVVGVVLAWAAAPGWTELVLLSPGRVGGIAAACTDAFRPYSPVLSAIVGCCYWWGWVPTCGLTALIAASALHQWLLVHIPVTVIAIAIVVFFLCVALGGMGWVARTAVPLAIASATLAFLSALVPVVTGHVDWHQAMSLHLDTPFRGWFGNLTSIMAGLYLIGFAAPAFEAATCHVGETIDPARNVPRAVLVSAVAAGAYFIVLPFVWLGALGPAALSGSLAVVLGPTYAPLFGASAKALAVGFLVFNMFHGTLQPLAGAARTLSQLADDGIFPRFLGRRSKHDVPWVATVITALAAILFLNIGDPIWLIAAANFSYLISIALPSVAVWLLRRDRPDADRPYRAPQGTIALGLGAAGVWALSALFGFEQFGLPTVVLGLAMAYGGGVLYAWRKVEDARGFGRWGASSLHLMVTLAMVVVIGIDGAGYFLAIQNTVTADKWVIAALQDVFVLVAFLTIGVGLVMPSMIAEYAQRGLAIANATLREGSEVLRLEIEERMLAERRLLHIASHDDLTGLANRSLFMERFHQSIARMERRNDHLSAVLFLDLDRFKLVNDSLGHEAGDRLLIVVADRLRASVRPGDTAARFGGDEFALLLEGIESEREVYEFGNRILETISAVFQIAGQEIVISASIGIAMMRTSFDTPEDVLRNADIAMYRAKQMGKNRCVLFAPEMLALAASLLKIETILPER